MRIGINTLFLVPGDVGGTEIYLRGNLKEMLAAEPDTTFVLFTSRDNNDLFRMDLQSFTNVEYVQLPFKAANRPLRILAEQLLLPRVVRRHRVDVLWSPGYTAVIRCRCPQAVTIHDLQYKTHPEDLSFVERNTLDFLVSSACRVCDAVIAVSEFSRQEIIKADFAAPEKIFAVLEGVDPVYGEMVRGCGKFEEITKSPYILCVAHTYPHKNVHLLIEAFGQIADTVPHQLILVGKARRGEGRVQQSLDASTVSHRIHRLNNVEFDELRALYQKADIFVLPSEYEGFGLPVLEAMLAGTIVVTSQKASLPEVGGSFAVYVDAGQGAKGFARAISDVISFSSEQKRERISGGEKWASAFTWKKSAEETFSVLCSVAAEHSLR